MTDQPDKSAKQDSSLSWGVRADTITRLDNALVFVGAAAAVLGAFVAHQPGLSLVVMVLTGSAATCAVFAVALALIAQLFYSPHNIHRRFAITRIAIFSLLASIALALSSYAVNIALYTGPPPPVIAVTQTLEQNSSGNQAARQSPVETVITVNVSASQLSPNVSFLLVVVTNDSQFLGQGMTIAGPDGTATTTLTIDHVPATGRIEISAGIPGRESCTTTLGGLSRRTLDTTCR